MYVTHNNEFEFKFLGEKTKKSAFKFRYLGKQNLDANDIQ